MPRELGSVQVFATAVAFFEAALFAVLAPLIASLSHDFHLSQAGAGLLSAAYPAGMVVATIPTSVATASFGPRRTAIAGVWCIAVSSVGFSLGESAAVLDAARFLQGVGAAAAWSGALAWLAIGSAPERRGAVFSATIGAAFAGTVIGAAMGIVVRAVGRGPTFLTLAVVLVIIAGSGGPRLSSGSRQTRVSALSDHRSPLLLGDASLAAGVALMVLVGLIIGAVGSIGPLLLSSRGADADAIALVFVAAYASQMLITPAVGILVDRRGPLVPIIWAITVSAVLLPLAAAVQGVVTTCLMIGVVYSLALGMFSPVTVLISQLGETRGADQGPLMAYANGGWALGAALGALALNAVASAFGDTVAFVIAAAVCATTSAILALRHGCGLLPHHDSPKRRS